MQDKKINYKALSMLSFEKQYEILSKGAVEIIDKKEFLSKLKNKKRLTVKAGFDPSYPDLHIGHSILINKLRQFQELGHQVVFIVGDFTACIGDPSGQNKTRPVLSFLDVQKNAKTYMEQATRKNFKLSYNLDKVSEKAFSFFKRLDVRQTKIEYNSTWLNKLFLKDFILSVCSKFTLARQLERNDFSERYKAKKPIGLHEFFYPILQAYDSVQIQADIELGGTDQTFNLLLGRELQKEYQQPPQIVLTFPLLEGMDGSQKMSKSLNNTIAFNDSAKDIYGKTMKISDELLNKYWKLFTEGDYNLNEIENYHPKKEKEKLAWILVASLYGEEKADQTQNEFVKVFSKKKSPEISIEYDPLAHWKELLTYFIYRKIKTNNKLLSRKTLKVIRIEDYINLETSLQWDNSQINDCRIKSIKIKLEDYISLDRFDLKNNKEFIHENTKTIFDKYKTEPLSKVEEALREIKKQAEKINYLLKNLNLVSSTSEARRKIQEKAVKKWKTDNKNSPKTITLNENISFQKEEEFLLSVGKRKFGRINIKWWFLHDLKAFLAYKKIKEGADRKDITEKLLQDKNFKDYISKSSLLMKIGGYQHFETGQGISNNSPQSEKIYHKYKCYSPLNLKTLIDEYDSSKEKV
ncbi:MAG: tyrosine--tRNA ligase [Bdellovibrionales bacterium]|nr:tyrosine--tRNA ligase [Bdellovibrionales bacterium]